MNTNAQHIVTLLCGAGLLMVFSVTGIAASESYRDSVYGWGSWELGIEPAAGGPIPAAGRPLRVQQNSMQFRPNQNSAFTGSVRNEMVSGDPDPIPTRPAGPSLPGKAAPGAGPGSGVLPGR